MARDAASVDNVLSLIGAWATEIARQRGRLRQTWKTSTRTVDVAQAKRQVLEEALSARQPAIDEVTRNFQERPDSSRPYSQGLPAEPDQWLKLTGTGRWAVRERVNRQFDSDLAVARQKLIESRSKTFGGGARRVAQQALAQYAARLNQMRKLRPEVQAEVREAEEGRREIAANERALADRALAPARTMAEVAARQLPASLQPWESATWSEWTGRRESQA